MDNKDRYTEVFLKAAGLPIDEKNVKDCRSRWWFSTREKSNGGLRITDQCLEFLETVADIKIYKIDLPKDLTIGPQVLIWLDQFLETPWHLEKRYIKVLSEKSAFELYLFSGDVRKLGSAKAMAKRLSQESQPQ
jgi:hypothetical protein